MKLIRFSLIAGLLGVSSVATAGDPAVQEGNKRGKIPLIITSLLSSSLAEDFAQPNDSTDYHCCKISNYVGNWQKMFDNSGQPVNILHSAESDRPNTINS